MVKHNKNLLGNSLKVTDKPIMKIINNQQDIKQSLLKKRST